MKHQQREKCEFFILSIKQAAERKEQDLRNNIFCPKERLKIRRRRKGGGEKE